jgi:hypothetical protein
VATGKDPILDSLGTAHLGGPKAFLGKRDGMLGEFRDFAMRGNMLDMAWASLLVWPSEEL